MVYLQLLIAIVAEVIATTALKASDGFTHFWPSVIVIVGYSCAFYFLSLCLRVLPVGVAYAIWAGLGVVLVAVAGAVVYGQIPDLAGALGMGLIIAGVVVLNLFSRMPVH